jgi:2-(1,2-epoxy-1,2-dihydrophenyl)acetyl-CoA isomerase
MAGPEDQPAVEKGPEHMAPDTPGSDSDTGDAPALVTSVDDGVLTLTLNRPAAFNAFDGPMKSLLLPAVTAAAEDDAVRVVVLTGTGRAFCAGQDLKEHLRRVQQHDPAVADTVSSFYNPLVTAITQMRKPVIAAVNGVAAGAGAALAFACDLRVAAASASFSMAFAGVALSADTGSSYTLPRLVGTGRAMRMMLLGQPVDAAEALRIGLVDEVVDDDAFADRVGALAGQLAAGPTAAYGWIKASVAHAADGDLAAALAFEDAAQADCFASADHREALDAFVAKRRPRFGRHDVR